MSFDSYIATAFSHLFTYEKYQFFSDTGLIQFYNCLTKVPMNIEQTREVPLIRHGAPVITNGVQRMKTEYVSVPVPAGTQVPTISIEFKINFESADGGQIGTVLFS